MSDLLGAQGHASRGAVSPVFVGRERQLGLLADGQRGAAAGRSAVVLIGGEAGIGKSRLVSEFVAQASGSRVLTGSCVDAGAAGLPFGPFTAVLRQLVAELGAPAVIDLLAGQGNGELARLLPELGQPAAPRVPAAGDLGEARARLFVQVLMLLERLAAATPVVLVIEDLHSADGSTRDLVRFLVGNQPLVAGLLIVITYRSEEVHRTHPVRSLLAELGRASGVQRLELPRLSLAESARQIAAILGHDPGPALVDAVFRRTEGNPLFAEQLLGCETEPPASVREVILANVRRLPGRTSELLGVASVGGLRVGQELLAAVTGLGKAELSSALRPAVDSNVLVTGCGGYQFRHALVREAVHDDLCPDERSRLHVRYAETLEAQPSLAPAGRAANEQAHHWFLAHDIVRALTSAWQAAAESGETLAHAEQLALLGRVLELWDCVPDAAERVGADHVRVLEQAARAAQAAGDPARAIAFVSAALAEVDCAADPVRAATLFECRGMLRSARDPAASIFDLHRALELVSDSAGAQELARTRITARLARLDRPDGRMSGHRGR